MLGRGTRRAETSGSRIRRVASSRRPSRFQRAISAIIGQEARPGQVAALG